MGGHNAERHVNESQILEANGVFGKDRVKWEA